MHKRFVFEREDLPDKAWLGRILVGMRLSAGIWAAAVQRHLPPRNAKRRCVFACPN
jgi:hypothetical protein